MHYLKWKFIKMIFWIRNMLRVKSCIIMHINNMRKCSSKCHLAKWIHKSYKKARQTGILMDSIFFVPLCFLFFFPSQIKCHWRNGKEFAFRRMFKSWIYDSTKQLWLQKKVSEPRTMNSYVAPIITKVNTKGMNKDCVNNNGKQVFLLSMESKYSFIYIHA